MTRGKGLQRSLWAVTVASGALLCGAPAAAQARFSPEQIQQGHTQFDRTCAQCHGTDGKAASGAAVPGLAGLPAPYFTEQMTAFKAGTRPATVMHQLAKGYSDAQIAELAAYFAGVGK